MGRTSLRTAAAAAALAAALITPSAAHAGPYEDVFADFQQDRKITACDHSAEDLAQARRDMPNDIGDYAPRFPPALDAAIEEQATTCKGAPTGDRSSDAATATGDATPAPPATTPTTGTPQPPGTSSPAQDAADGAIAGAAKEAPKDGSAIPAPLVALFALAAVVALALLAWGAARFFAWEPRWLPNTRHAVAEAGWRASAAWADFADWVRTRRTA